MNFDIHYILCKYVGVIIIPSKIFIILFYEYELGKVKKKKFSFYVQHLYLIVIVIYRKNVNEYTKFLLDTIMKPKIKYIKKFWLGTKLLKIVKNS